MTDPNPYHSSSANFEDHDEKETTKRRLGCLSCFFAAFGLVMIFAEIAAYAVLTAGGREVMPTYYEAVPDAVFGAEHLTILVGFILGFAALNRGSRLGYLGIAANTLMVVMLLLQWI